MNNGRGRPIVALDIDGTLGDYHSHFLRFAEGWFGRAMPDPAQNNEGWPLWNYMEVAKSAYKECKLAYRQGGLKRSMPVYENAAELTGAIQATGAEVWICTTRPYLRLDNIDPDTREWLHRNGIVYDAVLFDLIDRKYSKYGELARQAAGRVCAIMDDLPEAIEAIPRPKLWPQTRVLLRDQPYNRHIAASSLGTLRVHDLHKGWKHIKKAIEDWQEVFGGK